MRINFFNMSNKKKSIDKHHGKPGEYLVRCNDGKVLIAHLDEGGTWTMDAGRFRGDLGNSQRKITHYMDIPASIR